MSRVDGDPAAGEARGETCRNCGEALGGPYCARCGQCARVRVLSLWALLREVAGELLDFDSRMWRTLRPLAFSPGRLTQEYLRGRRAAYTPPFRLYLVLSLAFFLAASLDGSSELAFEFAEVGDRGASGPPSADKGIEVSVAPPQGVVVPRAASPGADPCDPASLRIDIGEAGARYEARLREICRRITGDEQGFVRALNQNVPRMMFLFLPLVAALLQLLHAGSGRYYVEHLLFCVHFHAFFFLAVLVLALLEALGAAFGVSAAGGAVSAVVNGFGTMLLFYVPWYLYRGMRVVYGQAPGRTMAKIVLLGAGYSVFLLLTGLGLLAYTALNL